MQWSPGAPSIPPQDNPAGAAAAISEAQALVAAAEQAAQSLATAGGAVVSGATSLSIPAIIQSLLPTLDAPPRPGNISRPTLKDLPWQDYPLPTPFEGDLNIDNLLPAPFTGTAPALTFGTAPTQTTAQKPASPSINLNFVYPDVDVVLPDAPSFLTINVVPFDGIEIPDLDADVPEFNISIPSAIPYVEGAFYTSALLTKVQADLQRALTDGTWTGLSTQAEQGLFDRASEREFRTQKDALDDLDRMETMGFNLPHGVYLNARIKIQTETQNTRAGLSREIMIKQAELQLTNVQDARKVAVNLEQSFITYYNQICERAFQNVKMVNDFAVQIFNAEVAAYTARVDAYKTVAVVYQAKIQGLLAKVDAYKAQIEAERLKVDMNTALVQQYKVQIDAALASIEVFKGKIQIIQTQAEIEKLKVDAYRSQIEAYTAEVNVFSAQVEAYKAGIQAEATKQQAFATQVSAYAAQVDAGAKFASAKVDEFKARIAAKEGELEAFKAQVQALTSQVQAAVAYNSGLIDEYKADIAALTSYNELLTKQWEAVIRTDVAVAEMAIKFAEAQEQLVIAGKQVTVEAAKGAAQVLGQLGAAALNAVHYSNSVSSSLSSSASNNASYSESQSASV